MPDRTVLSPEGVTMFLAIAAVLLLLWALGVVAFHVSAFAIHILLIVAVVALVWHFVSAGSRRSRI